ncbi:MAG: PAS domain S-box protein [Burkholderiales bacterium]|nr:PAS domain S-box protein [Burkholderiales bacterium]
MRHKDGSYRWMLSRGGAQADETGALTLRRGVHLDITDRKHAEQERSGARRRLQDIIASIRDGFVALDRNWKCTYANTAAARLLCKSREEVMGRNIWDLFPESRHLPIYEACMRCMQAHEPMQVDQYYAPHFRWYRNHLYPTDDGIAIFFEDFTARKRLEAQIVDERERYRATFEQPAIGILHLTLEGTVTRANQRMASLLGYQRADLVGLDFRMVLGETDVRAILDDVQHPSHGGATRLVECRFRRRDGEQFWGEMTLALVPGEGERPSYVVCMVQDISNRKHAETMLEESRQRLSAFAHQLTEAIEQERKRISREIHDELGQALTRLKMDLGWLRRRLGESAQAGGPVEERVLQMGRFIDETLISVRRLATELRPALLDNLGLAAALNAQMRHMSTQADIEIQQHLEPDLPLTSEQATGLYRIAQEALTNIIRHAHARRVRSTLFLDSDGVTMEIEDDGCGFDTAVQPPRGLGLVGIAERARLLGGRAQIESEPGRGTCVRVHLPVLEGSDEAPSG